jgi:hypothetical protein
MHVRYKEDSRAWRNNVLFSLAPLLIVVTLLHWRHFITRNVWLACVIALVLLMILACSKPGWFRGYYRVSTWAGFWSSQWVARLLLVCLFVAIITPAGVLLRLFGKDPLKLKRSPNTTSYWRPARSNGPLDRLF